MKIVPGTIILAALLVACARERLDFPASPAVRDERGMWYELGEGDAQRRFAILANEAGQLRVLAYDDDGDGTYERACELRMQAAADEGAPHLIIMLDSIPYQAMAREYEAGRMTWFEPPRKVIPPFPTMSGVIFTSIMHAPPLGGMINRYYDRGRGKTRNMIVERALGETNPWHQRLDYRAKYWENGLAFLWPRSWFSRELARVKHTFDQSDRLVTVAYIASTSGMLSRFGEQGLNEVLDGLEQLCAAILYERAGAVRISVLADHGHNLVPGTRISLDDTLEAAGFRPASRLKHDRDVVVENDGMVNYIGMHTRRPAHVARAIVSRPEVQLVMHREGERVILRSAGGAAAIEHREGRFRYRPLDADVLEYEPLIARLREQGKVDADGFIASSDWLDATADHRWPDAPPRLWQAFDGLVLNTPDVMVTLNDGYCTGLGFLEVFITMASTHGGLDQLNSATFVMSTAVRLPADSRSALRSDEVLDWIEPGLRDQLAARAEASREQEDD